MPNRKKERESAQAIISRLNRYSQHMSEQNAEKFNKGDARYDWGERHRKAYIDARDHRTSLSGKGAYGAAIVRLIEALALAADAHYAQYESTVGNDGVLGQGWSGIAQGIRTLLNGECGALDCGTLDSIVCEIMRTNNVDPDTGDVYAEDGEAEDA